MSEGSLKTGLGSSGGRLATTCSSARNALCPEQDVPSVVPEAFLPGECSYLTASCLGFPRCRKRLANGLYYIPCRYKEGCRVKCTEATCRPWLQGGTTRSRDVSLHRRTSRPRFLSAEVNFTLT